jgi:hypothetical protein
MTDHERELLEALKEVAERENLLGKAHGCVSGEDCEYCGAETAYARHILSVIARHEART